MPATALPTATVTTTAGIDITTMTAVDAANGNSFRNDGRKLLVVKNGGGSSINVTVDAYPTGSTLAPPDGLAVTDRVVAVAAGATKVIGPFAPGLYNDAAGNTTVAFSSGTSVTATVLEVLHA